MGSSSNCAPVSICMRVPAYTAYQSFFIFSNLLGGKWFLMKDLYKSVHSSSTYNSENTCTKKKWFLMKDLCIVASLITMNTLVSIKKAVKAKHLPEAVFLSGLLREGREQWTRSFSQRPQRGATEAVSQEDHPKSRSRAVWVRQPRNPL